MLGTGFALCGAMTTEAQSGRSLPWWDRLSGGAFVAFRTQVREARHERAAFCAMAPDVSASDLAVLVSEGFATDTADGPRWTAHGFDEASRMTS